MHIKTLQTLVANSDMIKDVLWRHDGSEISVEKLLEITSELQTQLEIQKVLLSTAKLLREHPSNKPLPNQQANRVKNFIKLIFESASHTNEKQKERQLRLRELDCTSLKFCGLSYTVREVNDMPPSQFEFLVAKIASFTEIHELSLLLCRDDINKIVRGDFKPEDETKFKEFIYSHIEARLAQQKSVDQNLTATASPSVGNNEAAAVPPVTTQLGPGIDPSRKRVRREEDPEQGEEVTGASRRPKYTYTYAPVNEAFHNHLGPLLSNAIKNSQQWKFERSCNDTKTSCLTTLFPEDPKADVSVTLWVDQVEGFKLNDIFKLIPNWALDPDRNQISSPRHATP